MLPKVGSFLNNATSTFDQITKVARGVMCIPALLGKLFSGGGLKSIPGAVLGAAANIVGTVIQNEVALIGNLLAQTLRQKYRDLKGLINTFKSVFNTAGNLKNKTQDTLSYVKNTDNCANAAAELVSCVLISATNLQKVLKKPAQQLQNFNNKLYDEVGKQSGVLNRYANKNLQFLDKAKMQMNLQNFL